MRFFVILWKHITGLGIETEHSKVIFFVILWKHVMGLRIEQLKLSRAKSSFLLYCGNM